MKWRIVLFLVIIVSLFAIAQTASATTPTGATYPDYIRSMMARECGDYCSQLAPDYVNQNYRGNSWWLDPTLALANKQFPKDNPLTVNEVTQYALAKAWHTAQTAQKDCNWALIRDNFPKFPTSDQFAKCDFPHSDAYWVSRYPFNVAATQADFAVSPPVFKWYNDSAWCEKIEYRGGRGECPSAQMQ